MPKPTPMPEIEEGDWVLANGQHPLMVEQVVRHGATRVRIYPYACACLHWRNERYLRKSDIQEIRKADGRIWRKVMTPEELALAEETRTLLMDTVKRFKERREPPKHGDINKDRTLRYCGLCTRWTPAVYASCYGDDCMAPFPEEPTRWNSQ